MVGELACETSPPPRVIRNQMVWIIIKPDGSDKNTLPVKPPIT